MKKITSIILASLLTVSASASAFAAEVQGGDSREITATYVQPAPDSICNVDVIWGSMEFNYNSGLERVWNPETLQYSDEQDTDPSWTPAEEGADIVTVTNHSNESIVVEVAYTEDSENGVEGYLANDNYVLASAVGSEYENAPSSLTQLELSAYDVPENFKEGSTDVVVGTLTVTITEGVPAIDATEMTTVELESALDEAISAGATNLEITLPENNTVEESLASLYTVRDVVENNYSYGENGYNLILAGITEIPDADSSTVGSEIFGASDSYYWVPVYGIASVSLPDVVSIGKGAFAYSSITSLDAPKLKSVDERAFESCTSLTSINTPNLEVVGEGAFYGASITSLYLPKLHTIGANAFSECSNLISIDLPEVTTIDSWTFSGTYSLTTVNLPKVTSIESMAFAYVSLTTLTLTTEENIYIHEEAFGDTTYATNIDLILNSNKQADVVDGIHWNDFTFKSITFVD